MPDQYRHGWHSRGYLPHFDSAFATQLVTYRLADAMPRDVVERLRLSAEHEGDAALRKRLDSYLDAGRGACWLAQENIAEIVVNAWKHFDGDRYRLHAWVVMPNHVHVIVQPIAPHLLAKIVQSWKSFTAKQINKAVGREGQVWQVEYWDRFIRNEEHYKSAVTYIHENPVVAGLVARADEWKWSSANAHASGDE
ncbi:transposase [bacterium]|nr:transposase [bacterium]